MLQRVSTAARSMQALLENALTATALDSQGLVPTPREIDLPDVVDLVLAGVPHDSVQVDRSWLAGLSCWADQSHLVQVLSNLVTNAVKYGGGAIEIAGCHDGDETLLAVSDHGPGVPRSFVPDLFERFSRSEGARQGRQKGSGLGLYIVRDLLALNGGSDHLRRHPGGRSHLHRPAPVARARPGLS